MNMKYNYIWYPLTSYYFVKNHNIKYQISQTISPYVELNNESINSLRNIKEINVNPYKRFNEEFYFLLEPEKFRNEKFLIEAIIDLNFHLLGEIDLYIGQNKKDIYVNKILKEISQGIYGEEIACWIKLFKGYEKHIIADVLYEMYSYLSVINSFKKVIKLIYPDSIFYDKTSSNKNMILYLNYSEVENRNKIELLKKLFFPIGLEIDIFWENHFGILDNTITMKIGEIAIF